MKNNVHFRFALCTILILTFFTYVSAQEKGFTLTGCLTDESGATICNATMSLTQIDKKAKTIHVLSDANGRFTIKNVPNGKYNLTATFIGYEDYKCTINICGDTNLGTAIMKESTEMLEGITVMAEYTDIKPSGETTIRVKGNPLAKGKSTTDFLKYSRELDVSDKTISIHGRENTLIYLDDREITFEQLKAISPTMIASIEIIPQADASYGINATGGVVKIRLRKEDGLLGSVSLYAQADKDGIVQTTPNTNLLYQKGKFSLSNIAGGTPYSRYSTGSIQKDVNQGSQSTTITNDANHEKAFSDNLSLRYSFNDTDRLDVYGGVSFLWKDYTQSSSTSTTDGTSALKINNDGDMQTYKAGLHLNKSLGNSTNFFTFTAEYTKNTSFANLLYRYSSTTDKAEQIYDLDLFKVTPEFTVTLNKSMSVSVGFDFEYMIDRHTDNGTETLGYITDGRFDNYGPNYITWAEYSAAFTDKLYLRAALMWHGGRTSYKDNIAPENSISKWDSGIYPSMALQWMMDKDKRRLLNIGYRRAYSYPNYNYRLPAVVWQSDKLYSIGNPDIDVQTYDNAEVYFALDRSWSASYGFFYGDDMVCVIMHQDANRQGVYYTIPENVGYKMTHTLRMTYAGRPLKFWYSRNNLATVYNKEHSPGTTINNTQITFTSDNDFSLCRNFGLELSFSASSRGKTLSYEADATYSLSAGVRLSLLGDKLSINLRYANILYNHRKIHVDNTDWSLTRKDTSSMSRAMLTIAWNFNSGRKIQKADMPTINNPVRQTPTF